MQDFTFSREPKGRDYRLLVSWLSTRASEFGFVVPVVGRRRVSDWPIGAALSEWLTCEEKVNRWPGTRERGGKRRLARYSCGPESCEALLGSGPSALFDWVPSKSGGGEDLFFLRGNGTVLLTTVAHEQLAWLSLESRTDVKEIPVRFLLRVIA